MYSQGDKPDFKEKHDAVGALNLFFSKHTFAPGDDAFQAGQNRFFLKPGWERMMKSDRKKEGLVDAAPGKVACRGYSYGVRSAMGHMLLNVNSATGLFYDTMTVAEYLAIDPENNSEQDLIGVRVWIAFKRGAKNEDGDYDEESVHLNKAPARTKTIFGFGERLADQQEAYKDANGKIVTVWGHMNSNYGTEIRDDGCSTEGSPESVCVNTNPKDASNPAYFLADDLYILPYQIYKRKIEGSLTSAIIKKPCRPPSENIGAIFSEGI
jgi:hypothetical protein